MDYKPKPTSVKVKSGKGSKAACEAAGWKFAPIASIGEMPITINGRTIHHRTRTEGGRGTMAIPPAGSGIEPRQFGGSITAVRWAVEQLGQIAKQPEDAPAGMAGVQLLLTAALASGEICGGGDGEKPARLDAELLSICRDVIEAGKAEDAIRARPGHDKQRCAALSDAIKINAKSAPMLTELHATTCSGLLQKARAAMVLAGSLNVTGSMSADLYESLAIDLIHLVPTLIHERGRPVEPPAGDAEVA